MSRSYKKNPVVGFCSTSSQAAWRRAANRTFRRKNDWEVTKVKKTSYGDIWSSPSDGYQRCDFMDEDTFISSQLKGWYKGMTYPQYKKYFRTKIIGK